MNKPALSLAALLVCLTGAAEAAAAAAPSRVFALVVTNNRSLDGSRPDLQYADDDGVRYRALFRTTAAPEDVVLLTRLDRQSRALYPALQSVA